MMDEDEKRITPKAKGASDKKFEVEIVYMKTGVNYHRVDDFTLEDLHKTEIEIEVLEKKFSIDPNSLYRKRRNIIKRLRDRHRGILDRYLIVLEEDAEGNTTAIGPDYKSEEKIKKVVKEGGKDVIRYELPITPKLLDEIERSGILKEAMAKLFATPFGGKKVLAIFVALLVGAITLSVFMGWIDLSALGIRYR